MLSKSCLVVFLALKYLEIMSLCYMLNVYAPINFEHEMANINTPMNYEHNTILTVVK